MGGGVAYTTMEGVVILTMQGAYILPIGGGGVLILRMGRGGGCTSKIHECAYLLQILQ